MFNWLSLKICYTIKHFFSFVNNEFPVFKIDAYVTVNGVNSNNQISSF